MAAPRLYVKDCKAYLVRDVREGDRVLGCEYGVYSPYVGIAWHACREGAEFSEMQPFVDAVSVTPDPEEQT